MILNFDIDRKSANFDSKNPLNINVDQIITELSMFPFHYKLVMNFYGTQKILKTDMNFIQLDGTGHWSTHSWEKSQICRSIAQTNIKLIHIQGSSECLPDKTLKLFQFRVQRGNIICRCASDS